MAGPATAGAWGFVARGHGTIPATWPAVPSPLPMLEVSIDATGRLLVDGVAQVSPLLDAALVSADGPFA